MTFFDIMALEQLLGYEPFVIAKANLAYLCLNSTTPSPSSEGLFTAQLTDDERVACNCIHDIV
ncbi:MAG: hypothetical protein JW942_05685 [Opitutales bacterium]|nr:hypothetical protein [Opitutales bacterium]